MKKLASITIALGLAASLGAQAAVSPEEAARLGNELTPWGAIAAGNADGSIPPYTGGLAKDKWPEGTEVNRPLDPFPDEKPLYSIDKSNVDEYAELLSPGTVAMIKQYGDEGYRLDVYPTHRTMSYPDWVLENARKNATNTVLAEEGRTVSNVEPGPPFPIPQNGLEVLWNHMLRWEGTHWESESTTFYVDENGQQVISSGARNTVEYPFYNPDKDYGPDANDFWYIRVDYRAPARRAGEKLLIIDPTDFSGSAGRRSYQYLKGQRRVRRAPAVAFDTPNPGTSGLATYDDAFMFNGSPERYDWKLIGKQEKIIPYHSYDLAFRTPKEEAIGKRFINPDHLRWEKHRVWVVEATLKDGARHVYQKRVLYFDEDTLGAALSDQYDGQGKLWRTLQSVTPLNYVLGAGFIGQIAGYDLNDRIYYMVGYAADSKHILFDPTTPQKPASFFTSQGLARGGVR
jgi:hypothetical protein